MHNVNCRFCSAIHSVNQGMYKRHFTSHSQCKWKEKTCRQIWFPLWDMEMGF